MTSFSLIISSFLTFQSETVWVLCLYRKNSYKLDLPIISYDLPFSFSKIIQFLDGIFSLLFLYIFYPIFDIFSRFFLILVVFSNDFISELILRWTFLRITSDTFLVIWLYTKSFPSNPFRLLNWVHLVWYCVLQNELWRVSNLSCQYNKLYRINWKPTQVSKHPNCNCFGARVFQNNLVTVGAFDSIGYQ